MKKRQLLTLSDEGQQLLHDLSIIEHGTTEHNLSKTVERALQKMAEDYSEELEKLQQMRELKKRKYETKNNTATSTI